MSFPQLLNGRQGMSIEKKVHLPPAGHPVMFPEVLMHEYDTLKSKYFICIHYS